MIKMLILTVAVAVLGCVPFMGLPGMVILLLAQPTTNLIYGPMAWEAWNLKLGDRAWPLAIMLTLIWPVLIPVIYLVREKFWPSTGFFSTQPLLFSLATLLVGSTLIAQIAVIVTGPIKRLSNEELVATAVQADSLRMVKKHYKPQILGQFTKDPLIDAIFGRKTDIAVFLIENRAEFSHYIPQGYQKSTQFASPLQTAVNVSAVELTQLLLKKGANPNQKNELGQTPLFSSAPRDMAGIEIIKLLRKAGTDFKCVDTEGNTPLMKLAEDQNGRDVALAAAKLMVEGGVDPRHKNKAGKSALDIARESHHETLVKYLESQ